MRPIDAEPLEEILRLRCAQDSNDYGLLARAIGGCLKLVQAQPTIAPPPNEPLTLEELRDMDGEPVWIRCVRIGDRIDEFYAIVHGDRVSNGRMLDDPDRMNFSLGEHGAYGIGWLAYRRKPEEAENE